MTEGNAAAKSQKTRTGRAAGAAVREKARALASNSTILSRKRRPLIKPRWSLQALWATASLTEKFAADAIILLSVFFNVIGRRLKGSRIVSSRSSLRAPLGMNTVMESLKGMGMVRPEESQRNTRNKVS